jgi:hypothetical protein
LLTARFLSVPHPALYLTDIADLVMHRVPLEEATSVVSRSLGRGLDLPELVFLWGRHLVAYRPEFEMARLFETPADLTALVDAALAIVEGPKAIKALDDNTRRLARLLDKSTEPDEMTALTQAAAGIRSDGIDQRARLWLASAERTAARAGLVCCGDVRVAVSTIRKFPLKGALALDALVRDLCGFAVSAEIASARAELGVEVPFERALAAG